jgi:hypothetical protein
VLLQNADDAKATRVRFVLDHNTYGTGEAYNGHSITISPRRQPGLLPRNLFVSIQSRPLHKAAVLPAHY